MPVTKPASTYIGSPFWSPRVSNGKTYAPQALVLHIMGGTLAGTDAWFNDSRAQVSAHFGVGKDGVIHQYIYEQNAAWANGIIEPGATAPILLANNWQNPNLYTLSIEHEGQSGDAMTAAQFTASTNLAAYLFSTFMPTIPIDRAHVLRHGEISPVTRAGCPGYLESGMVGYTATVKTLVSAAYVVIPPVDPRIAQARALLDDVIAGR
jgi:N-acetylmuramoyl-L-alanine amidase